MQEGEYFFLQNLLEKLKITWETKSFSFSIGKQTQHKSKTNWHNENRSSCSSLNSDSVCIGYQHLITPTNSLILGSIRWPVKILYNYICGNSLVRWKYVRLHETRLACGHDFCIKKSWKWYDFVGFLSNLTLHFFIWGVRYVRYLFL